MKRFKLFCLTVFLMAVVSASAQAKFLDTSNHTGSYLWAGFGFMNLDNDTNVRPTPSVKFGGDIELGYGLTYGYNITDWIAPEIQFNYSTSTGNTPSGQGREHALSIRLNGKYSFLTNIEWNQSRTWKIYPYAKVGGVAHALYVNAPNTNDKVGAWGFGASIGGGLEVNYKALYLGVDINNDLLFLQDYKRDIAGVSTTITNGGFDYQISVMGCVGVHF